MSIDYRIGVGSFAKPPKYTPAQRWLLATLIVLLVEGFAAGTLLLFSLHSATTVRGANLLTESSNPNNWACEHERFANTFGVVSADHGSLTVRITKSDAHPEHLILYQEDVNLVDGRTYAVQFRARASGPMSVQVRATPDVSDHYTTPLYATLSSVGLESRIDLDTHWQTYRMIFTADGARPFHTRVPCFLIGGQTGRIWFDKMALTEVTQ